MRKLDEKEVRIVRELIRDPRASDNQISRKTQIPVMTVNRKRKKLEQEHLIRYYTTIDKRNTGLEIFDARKLFIIKFKIGITRQIYYEKLEHDPNWRMFNCKFISMIYLGEKDGHLALILVLDASTWDGMVEEFNGKVVPFLKEKLGEKCIKQIITANLDKLVRVHHNYMPAVNIENGRIRKDWPDSFIFVNEV